jgi:phosphatidylserine/phosphatidylglycerophosphate/cardiolipin synthase-like enzyme
MAWVCAFLLALAIDYVYARWTASVSALGVRFTPGRLAAAMIWSALCTPLGYASLVICLDDWRALAPLSLGHATGTALAMMPLARRKHMGRPRKPTAKAYFTPDQCPEVWCRWIDSARGEVLIFSAVMANVDLAMALERARLRGVDVRLVLGGEEDFSVVSQAGVLAKAGCQVAIDRNHPVLSERTMVVDSQHVLTGNFPLTPSANVNSAASFVVLSGDPRLAKAYRDNFLHHEAHSRPRASQAAAQKAEAHAA